MKKKNAVLQRFTVLLLLAAGMYSCSGISKATDIFTNPSAKEVYQRDLKETPELFGIWKEQAALALQDSLRLQLPFSEAGKFIPKTFPVYAFEFAANPGEELQIGVEMDSTETLIFIDLFQQQKDSLGTFKLVKSAKYGETALLEEIKSPGIYKILVQPEIEANTAFQLQIHKAPVYHFPVASKGNAAIQSFWGAVRDGGRRSHEGIDIFAPRGTPVVATTKGRVTRTGNKGLGGKQVWMRDGNRGLSLYYAHLDSIIATPGMSVSPGDTLGLVGNTGNARTTPPHLHFGIYKSYSGAVNPLPYVFQSEPAPALEVPSEILDENVFISTATANLRSGPSTAFPVLGQIEARDTLDILGKSENWYHIRTRERRSFIHESLVRAI